MIGALHYMSSKRTPAWPGFGVSGSKKICESKVCALLRCSGRFEMKAVQTPLISVDAKLAHWVDSKLESIFRDSPLGAAKAHATSFLCAGTRGLFTVFERVQIRPFAGARKDCGNVFSKSFERVQMMCGRQLIRSMLKGRAIMQTTQ